MDYMVSTEGLDQAEVLQALYANARPLGWGLLHFTPGDLPIEEARHFVRIGYADYVRGRVIKVSFKNDKEFDPTLYDRDNGPGAAKRAIDGLRQRISGATK